MMRVRFVGDEGTLLATEVPSNVTLPAVGDDVRLNGSAYKVTSRAWTFDGQSSTTPEFTVRSILTTVTIHLTAK